MFGNQKIFILRGFFRYIEAKKFTLYIDNMNLLDFLRKHFISIFIQYKNKIFARLNIKLFYNEKKNQENSNLNFLTEVKFSKMVKEKKRGRG